MTPLNWQTPKTLLWNKNLGIVFYGSRVIANTAVRGLGVFFGNMQVVICYRMQSIASARQLLALHFCTRTRYEMTSQYRDELWPSGLKFFLGGK